MRPRLTRILLSLAMLAGVLSLTAAAQSKAEITLSVAKASTPDLKGSMRVGQPIYMAIDYVSDRPVRFQAKALSDSKEPQYFNATVVYPAGRGTALAWSSFQGPAVADAVFIGVFDENWTMVASKTVPARLIWEGVPARVLDTPAWAEELIAREAEMANSGIWPIFDEALFLFVAFAIPGYLILQIVAPAKLAGSRRKLALAPLLIMLPAAAHAVYAFSLGSSLWVIGVLFIAPAAFVWLAGVLVVDRMRPAL